MPTFLQHGQAETPDGLTGVSLTDLAAGNVERTAVTSQFQREDLAMYMAVTEESKYVFSAPDDREWLFDRKIDPLETRNRAANPMYLDETERMREILLERFRRDGYREPLDGDGWKHYPRRELTTDPDAYLLFQDPKESLPDIPGYERKRVTGIQNVIPGLKQRKSRAEGRSKEAGK
jgi:hypothetical protein